jgi:ribosome-associated protein
MPEEKVMPDLESLEKRERPPRTALSEAELQLIHDRARLAAQAAVDVKGEQVMVLDMHELVTYTDFLVLATGRNSRLTKRIAEEISFRIKAETGAGPHGSEGAADGEWILLDFLDFVVHVFTPETREFYRLDVLWKQAPMETVE